MPFAILQGAAFAGFGTGLQHRARHRDRLLRPPAARARLAARRCSSARSSPASPACTFTLVGRARPRPRPRGRHARTALLGLLAAVGRGRWAWPSSPPAGRSASCSGSRTRGPARSSRSASSSPRSCPPATCPSTTRSAGPSPSPRVNPLTPHPRAGPPGLPRRGRLGHHLARPPRHRRLHHRPLASSPSPASSASPPEPHVLAIRVGGTHDVGRSPSGERRGSRTGVATSSHIRGVRTMQISVTVNGSAHTSDVEPRRLLVHHLRDDVGLTGTNVGCDTSSCGACTVLVDGESVKSCTMLAVQADGSEITTIEGLADGTTMHPVQAAFQEHHGLQCGFCTPGHGDGGGVAARGAARPDRAGGAGGPRGQPLPLHRLPQHREGRAGRRRRRSAA